MKTTTYTDPKIAEAIAVSRNKHDQNGMYVAHPVDKHDPISVWVVTVFREDRLEGFTL